ncbi:MAG: hypothetical protein H0X14_00330 [Acidobacteria bacterium]|nr:hypothetical protein [Acidobacteriota bacterium]
MQSETITFGSTATVCSIFLRARPASINLPAALAIFAQVNPETSAIEIKRHFNFIL